MIRTLLIFAIIFFGMLLLSAVISAIRNGKKQKPSKKRMNQDILKMREFTKEWFGKLVPWNREELQLLGLKAVNKTIQKGKEKIVKGVFNSIYHEPLIVFAIKKYGKKLENSLVYARTSKNEFIYRIKNKGTDIFVDNEWLGTLTLDGNLLAPNSDNQIGSIRDKDKANLPILLGQKEVGSMHNPKLVEVDNSRAFNFVDNLELKDEPVFLSLAVLEMIKAENK